MSRLSFIDLAFFITESAASPKHVAGLSVFKKPKGSKADWVTRFHAELQSHDHITPPFNHVIDFKSLRGPSWREVEDVDINDHVIYHNPAKILKAQALYDYVARLHEPLMDR
ncbi:MAG: wax ester/triacylglycerol synthase domain-containing protein, partial [Pseudomonadales bacterium]